MNDDYNKLTTESFKKILREKYRTRTINEELPEWFDKYFTGFDKKATETAENEGREKQFGYNDGAKKLTGGTNHTKKQYPHAIFHNFVKKCFWEMLGFVDGTEPSREEIKIKLLEKYREQLQNVVFDSTFMANLYDDLAIGLSVFYFKLLITEKRLEKLVEKDKDDNFVNPNSFLYWMQEIWREYPEAEIRKNVKDGWDDYKKRDKKKKEPDNIYYVLGKLIKLNNRIEGTYSENQQDNITITIYNYDKLLQEFKTIFNELTKDLHHGFKIKTKTNWKGQENTNRIFLNGGHIQNRLVAH